MRRDGGNRSGAAKEAELVPEFRVPAENAKRLDSRGSQDAGRQLERRTRPRHPRCSGGNEPVTLRYNQLLNSAHSTFALVISLATVGQVLKILNVVMAVRRPASLSDG